MRRVAQVRRARRHRMQDAALLFLTQVLRVADLLRHPLYQSGGLVRIELIRDENPDSALIRRDGLRDVVDEIHFRAGVADARSHLFARCHFVIGDQALRAVANVFVFVTRAASGLSGHTWLRGLGRCGALQCLNAGLFIGTHQVNALRLQGGRGFIQVAHRFDLRVVFRRIPLRCIEPTFRVMQIQLHLILKNARQWSGKCGGRCLV